MPTTATTHISEHFEDLQSDDAFKPFSDFVNDHSTTHEINNHTHENKIHILQKFQEHVKDVLNNEQYKEWYSQQMIMGVALMEGIHPEVIQHLYNQNITINEEMQNIFQKNNVTLMDLSYNDVKFSEKDKQLFLYTMLFLHDGEEINPEQLYKSKYYTVENNNIFITEYGIKSFEQAFNCAWQIYNELFGNHELMLPHFPIKNEQEIYDLYKNKTSIESNGHTLDKEDKPLVLNITRALLHIQAHKKLDYTDNEHDPAGTIKYHEGMSWRDTYGEQINKVRDLEVKNFFASEINLLKMYDENNHLKNHRTPETYNAVSKSWLFKDIIFNNVHTTLT